MLIILNMICSDIRKFINQHKIITISFLYYGFIFNMNKSSENSFFENLFIAFLDSFSYLFVFLEFIIPKILFIFFALIILFSIYYLIYKYILSLLYRKADKLNNGNFSFKVFLKKENKENLEIESYFFNHIKMKDFTNLKNLKMQIYKSYEYLHGYEICYGHSLFKDSNKYLFKIYYNQYCIYSLEEYELEKFCKL